MAAVLAGGPEALLSHRSAAALWRVRRWREVEAEIVVPVSRSRRRRGIQIHGRRSHDAPGRRQVECIPVVHPVAALVDLAACVTAGELEAAIIEADHRGLVDPVRLRDALGELPRRPGIGRLRELLDRPTITDFFWPELGLVVEADSLRYHRTSFKQARDRRRDNAHAGSGLTTLRFTHGQIVHEPAYVRSTLKATAKRLSAGSST